MALTCSGASVRLPCRPSAGEDGCVCAYAAQRSYTPTTFVLAGFPLHATAMAVSANGKQLAVAALLLRPGSTGPPARQPAGPAGSKQSIPAPASMARPVIVLRSTLSMQPQLQVPVEGGSRVSQVQILPDGRHVLALTDSGRLLGFSCFDGRCVLDVPRCMGSPGLASALDPTGSFLVVGAAGGQLKVWGLQALLSVVDALSGGDHEECAEAAAVVRSLPCHELAAPAGSLVQGLAFLNSRSLLTVGSAGEVCCWTFCREPCGPLAAGGQAGDVSTDGALRVQLPARSAADRSARHTVHSLQPLAARKPPSALPVDCLPAAVGSQRPATAAARTYPAAGRLLSKEQQQPAFKALSVTASSRPASPAPRPLPKALQTCLPRRPPSAPPALPPQPDSPTAAIAAAADRLQSTSLPSNPQRGRRRHVPIWERYSKVPEASLVVTATPGKRCSKVVRQQRQLRVTSPAKQEGRSGPCHAGKKGEPAAQRSAQWVDAEVESDRVPAYRPSQQLQLLPPSATVQRVLGFEAAASFCWLPGGSRQELLYAAGNVLLAEDTTAVQQRNLARLPRDVSALAATLDGRLAAVAVRPAAAEGSTADIYLVHLQGGANRAEPPVLCHHSHAVQARADRGTSVCECTAQCGRCLFRG